MYIQFALSKLLKDSSERCKIFTDAVDDNGLIIQMTGILVTVNGTKCTYHTNFFLRLRRLCPL